jgi:hypothetical protein
LCGKLNSNLYKMLLQIFERAVSRIKDYAIESLNEQTITLTIYVLDTLYAFASNCDIFKDSALYSVLSSTILPCIIAKAYTLRNEDILNILFELTPLDSFPKAKVAKLLAGRLKQQTTIKRELQQAPDASSESLSKYMSVALSNELSTLIKSVNSKLDDNKLVTLKESDMISLYRHKNAFLEAQLQTANDSLGKLSELCNQVQQQNSVLSKLGERQELLNWCLQLDKEDLQLENYNLSVNNKQMQASINTFNYKIEKEAAKTYQMNKNLSIKSMEVESECVIFNSLMQFILQICSSIQN